MLKTFYEKVLQNAQINSETIKNIRLKLPN